MVRPARLAAVFAFAGTMGFFEASVVVYLRRLWELGEFDIASFSFSNTLILTEVLREGASLVMIASVALLAGRRGVERLAYAAVIFGVWDLLYYAFLRVLMGWPASLLDWDILFLIPRPWLGPVLAPMLVSAALIAGGLLVVLRETGERRFSPGWIEWALGLAGGALVIGSFLVVQPPARSTEVPSGFIWPLFLLGLGTALAGFARALPRRARPTGENPAGAA